ncbi:hypothetical protein KO561_14695 [Radiobacillus kanasensis]|uniref:hypothetical protein n=1 Tax=Radiobacillus kanasensis TaxID=2844358 RepID=UPI001E34C646|nr:hypothetical protein [Radiobacillus kanasensis]UFT98435.1 hypothetical protein KO561_14695 [Radiobacillus kanasensis]
MENEFKQLKKALDHTIFKDVDFNHQKAIQDIIYSEQRNKKRSKMTFWRNIVASTVVLAVCTVLFISYFQTNPNFLTKSLEENITISGNSKDMDKLGGKTTEEYPDIQDPGPLTKEELIERMMNTMDYFHTVEGKLLYSKFSKNEYKVNYQLELKEDQYLLNSDITYNDDIPDRTLISNGDKLYHITPETGVFSTENVTYRKGDKIRTIGIKQNIDGEAALNKRNRPYTGADQSLFPFEFVQSYLYENNNWTIVSQDKEMFGYHTIVVEGSISRRIGEDLVSSFKLWINRPTGVLLKRERYNPEGKIIDTLETTTFSLNTPIEDEVFQYNRIAQ